MTDKLSAYSTTAASNNSATPDGWPEGMAPSDVNNCAREMMARLREWYVDSEWLDHGHTIASSTGSTIVLSGDQTAIYIPGRAIRVNQSGSQVGRIASSVYSAPNTTVTVGGFTVSGPTQVEVGAISDLSSMPAGGYSGYVEYVSDGTILVSDCGKFINATTGGITLTLPDPAGVPVATVITVAGGFGTETGIVTVANHGGGGFVNRTASTVTVSKQAVYAFVSTGSNWVANTSGVGTFVSGTNGYFRVGGMVIQWGTATATANTSTTVTFPVAFPSACSNVVGTVNVGGAIAATDIVAATDILSTSQFAIRRATGSSGNHNVYWQAIGY